MLLIAVAAYNQMLSKSIAEQKIRMEKMISTLLRERGMSVIKREQLFTGICTCLEYLLKFATPKFI